MIDEYLNQFLQINLIMLYEEWNILVLNQYHILYLDQLIVVRHNHH